jgi:uncharacterized membrane-anchored protein YhcB (DUF1043 family)
MYKWFVILVGCSFLVFLLFLQIRGNLSDYGVIRGISDLFVLAGALLCTCACWYTAYALHTRRKTITHPIPVRAPFAWLFLGAAAFSYSLGQLVWTWYDMMFAPSQLPFPADYDPFYLLVYPLSWIGVAFLIPRNTSAAGRVRLLLDAGTAVASSVAVFWYFILGPTIAGLSGSTSAKVVGLAYPIGDLSLCVAAALLLFGPSGATALRPALSRLTLGMILLAVTDSLYAYFQINQAYHTGLLQDLGWPMSWLFIGWAALVYPAGLALLARQRAPQEHFTPSSHFSTTGAALRAILPMLLAVVTCALLLLEIALSQGVPLLQIVLVCAGLFLLPVLRQWLTLIDNLVLNDRLRTALDQSQQAFQHSQQELLSASTRAELYEELRTGIENLQVVHAKVARGDFQVRAQVHGPLLPVAQSLNLLIERMSRWEQIVQKNQILENEATQLHRTLDILSEGKLSPHVGASYSSLPTGGALLTAKRLQSRLQYRFAKSRELIEQIGRRWQTMRKHLQNSQQSSLHQLSQGQHLPGSQQTHSLIEKEIAAVSPLLHELWQSQSAYESEEETFHELKKRSPGSEKV